MRRSYLEDPSRAYPKVLVLISIVLGYLLIFPLYSLSTPSLLAYYLV